MTAGTVSTIAACQTQITTSLQLEISLTVESTIEQLTSMKFKQPSLGTNAVIFLPFLMS